MKLIKYVYTCINVCVYTYAYVFVYLFIHTHTHSCYRRNPSEKSLRKLRFIRQTSDLRTVDRVENIVLAHIRLGTHSLSFISLLRFRSTTDIRYDVLCPRVYNQTEIERGEWRIIYSVKLIIYFMVTSWKENKKGNQIFIAIE